MSFDKAAALYVYCMNYHTGQWSREYRILSKLTSQYRLQLNDSAIRQIQGEEPDEDWPDARMIYQSLVQKHQTTTITGQWSEPNEKQADGRFERKGN